MMKYVGITLRGLLMGAADVVPGVSGGTVAFITGIYEELIHSLNQLNLSSLKIFKEQGFAAFWKKINGSFLAALFLGIFISLLSLAKIITYVLQHYEIPTWAFFFGLIVASILYIGKKISNWGISEFVAIIIGTGIAYAITIAPPLRGPEQLWFIFLSGSIAICAMILPGISGSFILLLLGSYETILGALSNLSHSFKDNILTLLTFGAGCIVGILSFSKLVSYAFEKHKSVTMAVLTGFMIGSLNKVWPWKKVIEYRFNHDQVEVPFLVKSVFPETFHQYTGAETEMTMAVIMSIIGFALVFVLGLFDRKKEAIED